MGVLCCRGQTSIHPSRRFRLPTSPSRRFRLPAPWTPPAGRSAPLQPHGHRRVTAGGSSPHTRSPQPLPPHAAAPAPAPPFSVRSPCAALSFSSSPSSSCFSLITNSLFCAIRCPFASSRSARSRFTTSASSWSSSPPSVTVKLIRVVSACAPHAQPRQAVVGGAEQHRAGFVAAPRQHMRVQLPGGSVSDSLPWGPCTEAAPSPPPCSSSRVPPGPLARSVGCSAWCAGCSGSRGCTPPPCPPASCTARGPVHRGAHTKKVDRRPGWRQ
jgi:hypothetical protein